MKKIVISLVGKAQNYYLSIEELIKIQNPEVYLIIHSQESHIGKIQKLEETYQRVKFLYLSLGNQKEVENINQIIRKLDEDYIVDKKTILDFLEEEQFDDVVVDFTGGTKAMSVGVFLYFFEYIELKKLSLQYIGGERNEQGIVRVPQPYSISIQYSLFKIRLRKLCDRVNQRKDYQGALEIMRLASKYLNKEEKFKRLYRLIELYADLMIGKFESWAQLDIKDHQKKFYPLVDVKKFDSMAALVATYYKTRDNDDQLRLSFESLFFYDKMRIAYIQGRYEETLAFFSTFFEKYLYLLGKKIYQKKMEIRLGKPPRLNKKEIRDKRDFASKIVKKNQKLSLAKNYDDVFHLINTRNESIFAHGFIVPDEEIAKKCLEVSCLLVRDDNFLESLTDLVKNYYVNLNQISDLGFYCLDLHLDKILQL